MNNQDKVTKQEIQSTIIKTELNIQSDKQFITSDQSQSTDSNIAAKYF